MISCKELYPWEVCVMDHIYLSELKRSRTDSNVNADIAIEVTEIFQFLISIGYLKSHDPGKYLISFINEDPDRILRYGNLTSALNGFRDLFFKQLASLIYSRYLSKRHNSSSNIVTPPSESYAAISQMEDTSSSSSSSHNSALPMEIATKIEESHLDDHKEKVRVASPAFWTLILECSGEIISKMSSGLLEMSQSIQRLLTPREIAMYPLVYKSSALSNASFASVTSVSSMNTSAPAASQSLPSASSASMKRVTQFLNDLCRCVFPLFSFLI